VLSFHGMPERTLKLGDPYHCHCHKSARLLREAFAATHPDLRIATGFSRSALRPCQVAAACHRRRDQGRSG